MKSKWKVTANSVGDKTLYGVYRTLDTSKTDHSGNREMAGGYVESREAAQVAADNLNAEQEAKECEKS